MTMLVAGAEDRDLTEVLAEFEEQGFARLGRVLNDEALAALRERAEELMLGKVSYPGLFFQPDATTGRYEDAPLGLGWQGPSLRYRKLEKLELDDRFRAWLANPLFARIALERLKEDVVLYRAIIFNKAEGLGGSEVPWHQDAGKLWGLSRDPELQIWTALDDAELDGGCLEVIPGSHRRGLATPLGGVVPQDQVERYDTAKELLPLPVQAGEAILLHNYVWHRSLRSATRRRRLGFSACYMGASTRCLRKRRAPREFMRVFARPV